MNIFDKSFPNTSGIYKITTKHNNLFYIGSALDLKKRMKDHRNDLKRNECHIDYLQNVFNVYGYDDIDIEFLKIYTVRYSLNSKEHKGLIKEEEDFITLHNPRYNTIKTPTSQKNNPCMSKKVFQYTMKGKFLKEWPSGREVLRELNIQVLNGLKGNSRSSGGFRWSYKKVNNLGEYKRLSGLRKKVKLTKGSSEEILNSITDCSIKFGGERNTYQNIVYAIRSGKLYQGYKIEIVAS